MAFPQRWDGAHLALNLLLVPSVDPLVDPVVGAAPAFADRVPDLAVVAIPSLDTLPTVADPTAVRPPFTIVEPPAPAAPRPGFEALALQATAQGVAIVPKAPSPAAPVDPIRVRKALPTSYLAITGATPTGVLTTTTDEFGCEIRGQEPGKIPDPPPPPRTSWAELMSYALRQPRLAGALGLRYELDVDLSAVDLTGGGWVFVELAPADDWARAVAVGGPALDGAIRLYAARIPPLAAAARPVFAAVLFPVDSGGAAIDPAVTSEAEAYDSGFAQIVHAHQPTANDGVHGDGSGIPAATDIGIQLGWDDEQVVTWSNRQLDLLALRRVPGGLKAETPLGVIGYRVDVADVTGRDPADATPLSWESLMGVTTALPIGLGAFAGELCVEPSPLRLNEATNDAWLPHYFANWRGGCLAVADDTPNRLLGKPAAPTANTPAPVATLLSYGHAYAFRVRLADLSSGSAGVGDLPAEPGTADVAALVFHRMVPPKSARVAVEPGLLRVTRPVIGYPEVLFTGLGATAADRDAIVAHYLARAATIDPGSADVAGVPDPDVDRVRLTVEVAAPAHDGAGPQHPMDGTYRVLFTTERRLPALPPGPTPVDPGLEIDLAFVDAPSIVDWATTGWPDNGPLVVPRGRDVHVRVEPLVRNAPDYFGDSATVGLTTTVRVRAESVVEPALLVGDEQNDEPVRGLMFRRPPGVDVPPVVAQLAQTLHLVANGLSLVAPPGRRVVFGASLALRHTLSADGGTITFASESELLRHWVVPLVVDLDRDWTWDGLEAPITVDRDGATVGTITVPPVLSRQAAADPVHQDRARTHLVFLDAVDPHEPTPSGFPEALPHTWTMRAVTRNDAGPPVGVAGTPTFGPGHVPEVPQDELGGTPLTVTLPIAVPPSQIVGLVSVGVALSPYRKGEGYASTEARRRALWLELAEPVANPAGDTLFGRIVGHGADPLLYEATPDVERPPEPSLVLDPELVRIVLPRDSDDRAGIGAMLALERATDSDRHYLLPLPPGIDADSPELFGFWTWELRVGHAGDPHAPGQKWWSTAQGRFGRPLRVNGVQHPAPDLVCRAGRVRPTRLFLPAPPIQLAPEPDSAGTVAVAALQEAGAQEVILATATFATPVLDGRPLVTPFTPPKTSLCFFLYAQVVQADGSTNRNVLLDHRYGQWSPPPRVARQRALSDVQRDRIGQATFEVPEVEQLLRRLALPPSSALSMLAAELLPGGTGTDVGDRGLSGEAAAADPLGTDLRPDGRPGRILRVSPLVPVAPVC